MTQFDFSARIQPFITVDTTDQDNDLIVIAQEDGPPRAVLFDRALYEAVGAGLVRTPDGTLVDHDSLQLAFQNALIAKTGMCVLEHDCHRSGLTELAALYRSARGAPPLDGNPVRELDTPELLSLYVSEEATPVAYDELRLRGVL